MKSNKEMKREKKQYIGEQISNPFKQKGGKNILTPQKRKKINPKK